MIDLMNRRGRVGRGGRIIIDRLSEPKPRFGNMSHEIRTPMNAIIGYAELASGHLPPIRYSLRQGQSLLL